MQSGDDLDDDKNTNQQAARILQSIQMQSIRNPAGKGKVAGGDDGFAARLQQQPPLLPTDKQLSRSCEDLSHEVWAPASLA